ncbi:hypothetical protein [Gloeobacter morelensis]|uniref:Uncharacterized protein n=1 Tax=Gloeobacter morelensis MG652769 TaxID=2781736 RepID=A0ABY3PP59_9CYAN|nr:hypothetical protein [Gloeobacter morelensis]UFP95477.1 hypothetical protein ISF26_04300 [Gloeobacter morelensis MG652769]
MWRVTHIIAGPELPVIIKADQETFCEEGVDQVLELNDILLTRSSLVELQEVESSAQLLITLMRLDSNTEVTIADDGPAIMLRLNAGKLVAKSSDPPLRRRGHLSFDTRCIPQQEQVYLEADGQNYNYALSSVSGNTDVYAHDPAGQYFLAGTVPEGLMARFTTEPDLSDPENFERILARTTDSVLANINRLTDDSRWPTIPF